MVDAIVRSVEEPAQGTRVIEVEDIRKGGIPS
jgi:hypothetical protein